MSNKANNRFRNNMESLLRFLFWLADTFYDTVIGVNGNWDRWVPFIQTHRQPHLSPRWVTIWQLSQTDSGQVIKQVFTLPTVLCNALEILQALFTWEEIESLVESLWCLKPLHTWKRTKHMHNAFVIYPVDTRFKECFLYNSKVSRLMIQYMHLVP